MTDQHGYAETAAAIQDLLFSPLPEHLRIGAARLRAEAGPKIGEVDPTKALRILNLQHLAGQVARHGVAMHGAPAVGMPLHTNGHLGADLVYVEAGDQFPVHTHPGDHLLLSIGGVGTITLADVTYRVEPGDIYMVDGDVPHAVGAHPDSHHVLVAIGAPHKAVDSPERMAFTDWLGRPVEKPIVPSSVPEEQRAAAIAAAEAAVKPAPSAYAEGCCDELYDD